MINHVLFFQVRPIVATFRSIRDKENILRHTTSSKILRQKGISVTEDFSNKRQNSKNGDKVELRKRIILSEVSTIIVNLIEVIQLFKIDKHRSSIDLNNFLLTSDFRDKRYKNHKMKKKKN